jgi:Zn-dependent protease
MNKKRSTMLAIGAFLLANLKWLLGLLKFSKFGATFLSMFLSLILYANFYGWKFAAALIYLIFVHEMGHLVAAKQKGIRTSPAIFIPFAGALISMKDQPRDAATEAYLAYGGPLAGLISILPALPLYWGTGDPFWALVIYLGATINLFNLLPVSPLDGGRIVTVLSTKIWLIGLLGILALLLFSPSPMLFLIFFLGAITWWNRSREGYKKRVLTYERERLGRFLAELRTWPTLLSVGDTKERLYDEYRAATAKRVQNKRFFLPFLQDDKRFAVDRARIDRLYAELAWNVYQQWERTPVLFLDADPEQPLPSPILMEASRDAERQLSLIENQLERLSSYYEAPAGTKWKVLIAYLALAAALSVAFWYGSSIIEP